MSERFETLYKLDENLYVTGAPIIISAGVLLKDTKTENVITQLKFQSVSENPIRALKVSISAYDVSGKVVSSVDEYQYLDLHIQNGDFFGFNKAIVMPDSVTRSIKIEKILVIYEEGYYELDGNNLLPIAKSQKLSTEFSNPDIIKQYQIDACTHGEYIPKQVEDLWICSCGKPNSSNFCTECSATKEKVFAAYNPMVLKENLKHRLEAEKAEEKRQTELAEIARKQNEEKAKREAEQKVKEEAERKKKIKICSIIGTIAVIIVVVIISITSSVQHKNAVADIEAYISSNQYEHAFDRVNDSNLSSSEKRAYCDQITPYMKKQWEKELEGSQVLDIDGLKLYESSGVIYYFDDADNKVTLYEMSEPYNDDDFKYITDSFIYANGYILFVERTSYTDYSGESANREAIISLNLETKKCETLDSWCDFNYFAKLENGHIYAYISWFDGIIFNPYNGTVKSGKDLVSDYEKDNAIYKTGW